MAPCSSSDDTKPSGQYLFVLICFLPFTSLIRSVIDAERGSSIFVADKHNPLAWLATNLKGQVPAVVEKQEDNEDEFYPARLVDRFAAADRYNTSLGVPFSVVSTLRFLSTVDRTLLLEQCPEAKVLFPALHDPSCFGAPSALNKDRCYASLCVSHPKAGGC